MKRKVLSAKIFVGADFHFKEFLNEVEMLRELNKPFIKIDDEFDDLFLLIPQNKIDEIEVTEIEIDLSE